MTGERNQEKRNGKSAWPARRVALLVLRWAVAAIFLTAGISKLLAFPDFLRFLADLPWVPAPAAPAVGAVVWALEIWIGLCLLINQSARTAAVGGVVLSVAFAAANTGLLLAGSEEECGCFGAAVTLPPERMLGVNAFLLVACATLLATGLDGARRPEREEVAAES